MMIRGRGEEEKKEVEEVVDDDYLPGAFLSISHTFPFVILQGSGEVGMIYYPYFVDKETEL